MACLTHSRSPQISFPGAGESRGPPLLSLSPGGRPEHTACGPPPVPSPQLTAGQQRGKDGDAQHDASGMVQGRVAVGLGRDTLIGRCGGGPTCSRLSRPSERNLFRQGPFPDLGWLLFNLGRRWGCLRGVDFRSLLRQGDFGGLQVWGRDPRHSAWSAFSSSVPIHAV